MTRYEWGIESSDRQGMMAATGCGHKHQTVMQAASCLSAAEQHMTTSDQRIAGAGVYRIDGSRGERLNDAERWEMQ